MKNDFFITYAGVVEFVTKTQSKENKAGESYYIRSLAVNLNDTNPKYPVTLVFDLVGNDKNKKKIDLVEGISKGEEIVVTFTINSRSYVNGEGETRYFPSFNLIKVENAEGNQTTGGDTFSPEDDDLPFN